jgi:hypothetical protein
VEVNKKERKEFVCLKKSKPGHLRTAGQFIKHSNNIPLVGIKSSSGNTHAMIRQCDISTS